LSHPISIVGPYDKFAIEWGYKPIPGATTPDQEKPALHALASKQSEDSILRFGQGSYIDPSAQTEDLGADRNSAREVSDPAWPLCWFLDGQSSIGASPLVVRHQL